ncbi:MAG TPA: DUF3231 family protein [Symbiobacteriaceae bacterium]|nr:DUF3231 family protein [Symbiobacteriaceae bacterium]
MNLLESLLSLLNKEEKPLHAGEVMHLWKIMAAFTDGHTLLLVLLNHASDTELKRYIESFTKDFEEPWMKRFTDFMQNEGIPLPPASAVHPKANHNEIPLGAKFTDGEIASVIAAKVLTGTAFVQAAILDTLHYGLARMLMELELAAYRQAFVLRQLMEERGWMKAPPAWNQRSRPN